MTAIIVDDEKLARATLRSFLEEFCSEVEILDEAGNVPEAVKSIMKYRPNLVFLDIEMPGFSGLELASFFEEEEINFHIIFTTAYAKYAVDAFRLSAIDYLLKPIDIEQLQEAVARASKMEIKQSPQQLALLQEQLNTNGEPERIAFSTSDGIEFHKISDILFLEADGSYTYVYFKNGERLMLSKKLGEFDMLEALPNFYKSHRSFLVNLNEIQKYVRSDGGYIVMNGDKQVPLSKQRKSEFLELINEML